MKRIAVHLVWGCYGFWLPNDPRGSWSVYVGSRPVLDAGGPATTVNTRRSLANKAHDAATRRAAKAALAGPPVRLNGTQAREAARGIGQACDERGDCLSALCVMPDHVHAVIVDRDDDAISTIGRLKSFATKRMNAAGVPPRGTETPWCRGGWFVPLDTDAAVRRAIAYVEQNPVKAGLRVQQWSFVRPWPPTAQDAIRSE